MINYVSLTANETFAKKKPFLGLSNSRELLQLKYSSASWYPQPLPSFLLSSKYKLLLFWIYKLFCFRNAGHRIYLAQPALLRLSGLAPLFQLCSSWNNWEGILQWLAKSILKDLVNSSFSIVRIESLNSCCLPLNISIFKQTSRLAYGEVLDSHII